jgi:hypothetical protein
MNENTPVDVWRVTWGDVACSSSIAPHFFDGVQAAGVYNGFNDVILH